MLLLHGYPQTHITRRRLAPALASRHRLVALDLPGYGASRIDGDIELRTKRQARAAIAAFMKSIGHDRFAVVGHDRGARVGYRMALDYPDAVRAFASLAVVPTLDAMEAIDFRSAAARFHWFFLSQPEPLPERLLAADPALFLDRALDTMARGRPFIEDAARRAYHDAFNRPEVRRAICEDYRAALDEDLAADRADRAASRRLSCPVLSLWSADDHREDAPGPLAIWRRWADDVAGAALPGGHLLPEEASAAVLEHLIPFLART